MIHSLAGGSLGKEIYLDFALVEILEGLNKGNKFWYISKIQNLSKGDIVLVSVLDKQIKGSVIRVDKNVSYYQSPIPVKRAKTIIRKI